MAQTFNDSDFLGANAFGEPYTVDGSKIYHGSLDERYVLSNGVESLALVLTVRKIDAVAENIKYGTAIEKDGVSYVVRPIKSDSSGFIDLILEEQD